MCEVCNTLLGENMKTHGQMLKEAFQKEACATIPEVFKEILSLLREGRLLSLDLRYARIKEEKTPPNKMNSVEVSRVMASCCTEHKEMMTVSIAQRARDTGNLTLEELAVIYFLTEFSESGPDKQQEMAMTGQKSKTGAIGGPAGDMLEFLLKHTMPVVKA